MMISDKNTSSSDELSESCDDSIIDKDYVQSEDDVSSNNDQVSDF